jgi:hypothetical protein
MPWNPLASQRRPTTALVAADTLIFCPCKSSANDCRTYWTLASGLSHAGRPSAARLSTPRSDRPGADIANASIPSPSLLPSLYNGILPLTYHSPFRTDYEPTAGLRAVWLLEENP